MFRVLSVVLLTGFVSVANAQLCSKWSAPQKLGLLDTKMLKEVSGLTVSKQFPDRIYHHNDSKDVGAFYITDLLGGHTQEVLFTSEKVTDIEDTAMGPCDAGQCLFLGDIGDNKKSRKTLDLWILPEAETFQDIAVTARKVSFQYPDGPHNAESMAVHPKTGDVYILTKEADEEGERRSYAGKLYRLPRSAFGVKGSTLQFVGTVDLPWMNYNYGLFGGMATGMDISPDGQNLLVATYENIVEISMNKIMNEVPNSRSWKRNQDYRVIDLRDFLSQMEAVGYSADGNSFYFESEFNKDDGDTESPLFRMDCLAR